MKTIVLREEQIHSGELILVNRQHPYQKNSGNCNLMTIGDSENILLNRNASVMLSLLMKELNGWRKICLVSGWRSMREQRDIFDKSLQDNGYKFTNKYIALAGTSEHQTGLAIDLALKQDEIDFLCPNFPYDGICQKFREKALSYGFVERYPQNKEDITGIAHEPWHFRYVGIPHAEIMNTYGMVLEEYIDFIKQYPYGEKYYSFLKKDIQFLISYLEVKKIADTQLIINEKNEYTISGNNVDGYIITERRL